MSILEQKRTLTRLDGLRDILQHQVYMHTAFELEAQITLVRGCLLEFIDMARSRVVEDIVQSQGD